MHRIPLSTPAERASNAQAKAWGGERSSKELGFFPSVAYPSIMATKKSPSQTQAKRPSPEKGESLLERLASSQMVEDMEIAADRTIITLDLPGLEPGKEKISEPRKGTVSLDKSGDGRVLKAFKHAVTESTKESKLGKKPTRSDVLGGLIVVPKHDDIAAFKAIVARAGRLSDVILPITKNASKRKTLPVEITASSGSGKSNGSRTHLPNAYLSMNAKDTLTFRGIESGQMESGSVGIGKTSADADRPPKKKTRKPKTPK